MEEAEALCDRIGIMKKGKLKCLGTINSLKDRHHIGYKLSVALHRLQNATNLDSSAVESFVRALLPNATLEYNGTSHFIFRVKKIDVKLSTLFLSMDSQIERRRHGLSRSDGYTLTWSVSCASLEELFLKIVKPNLV
jgi:ABC-type multidrug transport system ATPase subunit